MAVNRVGRPSAADLRILCLDLAGLTSPMIVGGVSSLSPLPNLSEAPRMQIDPGTTLDPSLTLLRTEQVAELLQVTPTTLENWRWRRTGPRYLKVGRTVLYRLRDITEYLDHRTVELEPSPPAPSTPAGPRGSARRSRRSC